MPAVCFQEWLIYCIEYNLAKSIRKYAAILFQPEQRRCAIYFLKGEFYLLIFCLLLVTNQKLLGVQASNWAR